MPPPLISHHSRGKVSVVKLANGSWMFSYDTLVGVTINMPNDTPTPTTVRYQTDVKLSKTTTAQLNAEGYRDATKLSPAELYGAAHLAL
jgi:hypothetical protein